MWVHFECYWEELGLGRKPLYESHKFIMIVNRANSCGSQNYVKSRTSSFESWEGWAWFCSLIFVLKLCVFILFTFHVNLPSFVKKSIFIVNLIKVAVLILNKSFHSILVVNQANSASLINPCHVISLGAKNGQTKLCS